MMILNKDRTVPEVQIFERPWFFIGFGLALVLVALIVSSVSPSEQWLSFLLVLIGLSAIAGGIVIRPRSSLVLAVAALGPFLASLERKEAGWDSAFLLLIVLTVVAGLAAIILLLPRQVQYALVSLAIVLHFGGIITAVTSASAAWVPNQLWTYVYRPYLYFMYLNNAYHFYSPEPGPAPLLWFRIEYERGKDGSKNVRWIKVPDNDEPLSDPDGKPRRPDGSLIWPKVEYTRRLSLAESVNFPAGIPTNFDALMARRLGVAHIIPTRQDMPIGTQYREPSDVAKRWLEVYARHVAHTFKHEEHPELKPQGVKIYRVTHEIINAEMVAEGQDPNDPLLYAPFYMGEFDSEGKLRESCLPIDYVFNGRKYLVSKDPFLYWLIPIMSDPTATPERPEATADPHTMPVINYVLIQAGDGELRSRQ